MNKKVLNTLEYNKIIDLLEQCACSEQGKAYCRALKPVSDRERILKMQTETKDALSRIFKRGSVSFSGVKDVRPFLKHLEIGGTLNAIELLSIASMLQVCKRVKAYGRSENDTSLESDSLAAYFHDLAPLTPLCEEINRCILAEDTIADDASPGLKNVRRQMSAIGERIRTQMNTMLSHPTTRGYLQEGIITLRNGRYCLPVKAEYKSQVPGMVHDQSSTGSTIFIEPMSVVHLNNSLRELQLQEQEEIEKILATLSNLVAEHTDELTQDFSVLAELDFIFAKGELAKNMNAVEPVFHEDGIIRLRGARHPLLAKDTVVPIDLTLGEEFDLLIVTGPNTGGKTVSLKTCGLLTLMGQAGLHIPAKDRSQLSIFDDIYADIGDEQSIEQSLSTFSSHMTNIIRILKNVNTNYDKRYLCLFDELCAGTDPKEGAALATAILDRLHQQNILTMATTHYTELKMYALSTPGVENACCEFSLETLSPTYHLLIGIPGKSNAFAISQKLGLSTDLIQVAKQQLDEDAQSFEDLLVDLEQTRVAMEQDRAAIARERLQTETLRKELEQREEKLNQSKEKILRQANEDASHILQEAKRVADETIRDFNKYSKTNPDIAEMEEKRAKIGKKLKDTQGKAATAKKEPPQNHNIPKHLRIGDPVKVLSMNLTGTVYSLPNAKGDLQVQMGIMRSNVNIKDLVLMEDQDTAAKTKGKRQKYSGSGGGFNKSATISPEINLLGLNGDEAVAKLDKYLDDAYISHLSSVRVVHGKGTGALRKAVQQYLRRQKIVEEFHLAEFGEGDAGVTIVTFK